MPVYYTGEGISGPIFGVWILDEDYINPSGEGMERVSDVRRGLIEEGLTEAEADEGIAEEVVVASKGEPLLDAFPPSLINDVPLARAAADLGIILTPEVEEFGRQFEALMQTEMRDHEGAE